MKGILLRLKSVACGFFGTVKERFQSVKWRNLRVQEEDIKIGCGLGLSVFVLVLIKRLVRAVRKR